ncbi:MAG: hypothetical protein U9Q06_00250 [Nanoarchaeota archaeon]|nr:hypothetical protein [Nanoarchaeota archaeon]
MIKEVGSLFRNRKGLTVSGTVIAVVIVIAVLVLFAMIYFGFSGKLGFLGDKISNLLRFGQ